jgi:ABC-type transport system involved in multi-copper enzyme maturation permease subunit
MAMHDLGYRGWTGALAPGWTRWLVITQTGVRRAWQSRWLRRMLLFAWFPAIWFGLGFFLWEQSMVNAEWRGPLRAFLRNVPNDSPLAEVLGSVNWDQQDAARHTVWAWLLLTFFRNPQGLLMVLAVGLIAPALISQDVRSRAFLLYFSRPVSRREYVLGKLTTVWVYLLMIATLPAVSLYVLGVLLSPNFSVIQATWDLPLRIFAASAVLMIPTATLALCLSSLTQESRYAGFAWFAIWILGTFTYLIMSTAETFGSAGKLPQVQAKWSHLSLYHTLGRVQSWIFGFTEFSDVVLSGLILIAITIVSVVVLFRRVAAPMQV